MNKSERTAFILGIIGLLADLIALTTFFAGLWGAGSQVNTAPGELPLLVQILIIFSIIYGWLIISWFLIRRKILLEQGESADKHILRDGLALQTVFSIGIIIAPLFIGWWIAVGSSSWNRRLPEAEQEAIVHATQEAQAFSTAQIVYATAKARGEENLTQPRLPKTTTELIRQEKYNVDGTRFMSGIGLYFALFIGIFLIIMLLMPVVYPSLEADWQNFPVPP